MPITRRQFDLGVTPEIEEWMRAIYGVLTEHRDLAYLSTELQEVAKTAVRSTRSQFFDGALEKLVGLGAAEARDIGGVTYFGFHQEFDTSIWKPLVRTI